MQAYISGLGTALPPYRYNQQEVADFLEDYLKLDASKARWLKKAFDNSGIAQRYSVLPDFRNREAVAHLFNGHIPATKDRMTAFKQNAGDLAAEAAVQCLNNAQTEPQSITHLITVSCTGLNAPGLDIELIDKLDLPPNVERTGINFMGCYAVFNALKTAGYITQAEPNAKVLIAAVELCSIHFNSQQNLEQMVSSALFGDGAGAALVTHEKLSQKGLWLKSFKSDLIPATESLMTWNVGNEGFEMFLSREIPCRIKEALKPKIEELLIENNYQFADIGHLAAHPGGLRILDAIETTLPLNADINTASREVLQKFGNMSSPTILFVIQQLLNQEGAGNYPKGMLGMAFGPGLTLETGLFEIAT